MSPTRRRLAAALTLAAAFVLARGPLHRVTFALPVSNDDAILLLMGRHVLRGELATTLWSQPYNGALDAYLLAPGLAIADHHLVFRLYELACAAALVLLVFLLGHRLGGERAGWAGGLLAAVGTPYMALMAATGPPPNFLMPLVTGFPLLAALSRLDRGSRPLGSGTALGTGAVCGLAVWNSSLAIPAFAGMAAGLALAGFRPRPRGLLAFLAGFALGVAPLGVGRLIGASGARIETAASAVTSVRPRWLWAAGLVDTSSAVGGLLGLRVPVVVDGMDRLDPPTLLVGLLAVGLVVGLALGVRSRRALPLLGWALALLGAFALSRRAGPQDVRYLYGLNAPLLALVGAGAARVGERRLAAGIGLAGALLVPWMWGQWRLARIWADPAHAARAWEVPPIEATLSALRAAGVRSAYASLQFAGRMTLESGGTIVASQAWNERIPGDPLRFRDEVDLDPAPAWVLSPRLSRGMPRAGGFRGLLQRMGGSFREERVADLVVFSAFRPPFDEARPIEVSAITLLATSGESIAEAALDRDPATVWASTHGLGRGSGILARVTPSRRLSALVLAVDLERSPAAVPWAASVDGAIVAEGPIRSGFQWVNGAPRAGKQALLVVPLEERRGDEVRLVFQAAGPPLVVAEVFVYGPDEPERPPAGSSRAAEALAAARAGRWDEAVRLYGEAVRLEPGRSAYHASWLRARWRAAHRPWLDVESLDDGGPELVDIRD